jgi:hypothetical protein
VFILKNINADIHDIKRESDQSGADPALKRKAVAWLRARMDAVRKARLSAGRTGLAKVYSAVEFSRVFAAEKGETCWLSEVIPHVTADYYSYCAHELSTTPQWLINNANVIRRFLPGQESRSYSRLIIGDFRVDQSNHDAIRRCERLLKISSRLGIPLVFISSVYGNDCSGAAFFPAGADARRALECRPTALFDISGRKTRLYHFIKQTLAEGISRP